MHEPPTRVPLETKRATVVFDLDGTLVLGDSFGIFCLYLAKRSPLRGLAIVLVSPLLGLLGLHSTGRPWAARGAIWLLTLGLTAEELLKQRRLFAELRFPAASPHIIDEAVRELLALAEEGAEIFVVTGCEEELARLIVGRLELPVLVRPKVLGSQLEPRKGGFVPGFHCYGERKLEALGKAGQSPPYARVYTDSSADLPLLRAATQGYLVRPSPRHRARVTAALPDVSLL
jgi:phosphatidylglycerophosphatase C